MWEHGWYCHRRDHRRSFEDWHYNFLGHGGCGFLHEGDRRTSAALERLLTATYGEHWVLGAKDLQRALAKLGLYGGNIDGDIGPLSKIAVQAFQRAWTLKPDKVPGPITQRTLAYVTAGRVVVPQAD
jgi:hypothetical protein